MGFFESIRRKPDSAPEYSQASMAPDLSPKHPLRMSGTNDDLQYDVNLNPSADETELGDANGRTGNDYMYPDLPRGRFDINTVNGDRLQDFANSHLSEGEAPGRIPRGWNNRSIGKTGRNISGNPSGDNFLADTISGDQYGGIGDMVWVPHTPTPRNTTIARPYLRTIDDSASIPGVYVADATRR